MSKNNTFLAGIGVGILLTSLITKFFDLSWLMVSAGVLLLVLAGTGILSKKK